MLIVLIPVAWIAVLILTIALCRASARADEPSSMLGPADRPEISAGPDHASEEILLHEQIGSVGSAPGRFGAYHGARSRRTRWTHAS